MIDEERSAPTTSPKKCPFLKLPRPPLAKGLPILGNTFQFLKDTTGLLVQSYRKLGPVYRVRALWLKYTVIAGKEGREFMKQGLDAKYLDRKAVFAEVGKQLGAADFVLGQSGEKHLRFRRLLSVAYSREVASHWVPEMIEAVREHSSDWSEGHLLTVMDKMQELAFEQYCRVMCGQSLREHYRDCLRVTDYNMNVGGRVWPFFMYRMPWYQKSRSKVLDLMWGMVRRKKEEQANLQKATIMDTLMSLRDKEGKPLSDDEVVCYSMYGFAGSCSYMGRHIAFMLYELLQHPELLQDVRREVDNAFAHGLKDAKDIRSLKLLQAVYLETLRFHPVSQGMPHIAAQDFEFDGKRIGEGELTVISQVPMSFSKCPFENPESFDPSRCLEPRSEHTKENSFHPFGIGHRKCTAAGLVELMSLTMVATLIHEMKFSTEPKDYQLKLNVKPLPAPNSGFKLKIDQRRSHEDREKIPPPIIEESVIASLQDFENDKIPGLLKKATPVHFSSGETIITESDPADAFYVVNSGQVTVSKLVKEKTKVLKTLHEGDFFGEIGLLQGVPRTASVNAAGTGTTVLRLDEETFQELIATSDLVSEELARLLERRNTERVLFDSLPDLTPENAAQILPEFTQQKFEPGEIIIKSGDPSENFYILVDGEVVVSQLQASGEEIELNQLSRGNYFGETGLLTGSERSATVKSSGESETTVLVCGKEGFHSLLESTGGEQGNLARSMANRLAKLSDTK